MQLIFATRPSVLARWQTVRIIQLLQAAHPGLECNEHLVTTAGDRLLDRPLPEIGGKGLFTGELEEALLSGKVHAAVHSLKDLPVEDTPGILVAAIPEREAAYDVLVSAQGWTLFDLPEGARVGTCSPRRAAQLLVRRPNLNVLPLRGNVETRLQKLWNGEYDAIVLAQAGLIRLGLQAHISEVFSLDVMLPAPGQGALAVQCRADDVITRELLATIHDPVTAAAVYAERAFLASLGGGCAVPVAAFAETHDQTIILTGAVFSEDGKQIISLSGAGMEPDKLGKQLADLVLERGAAELLKVNA
ncbi:MAG TPA: hydroxymethylbilane synthase [Anaerolineales bacterium]|nr:hydroxymethylbilane synthase [Anaerolineales bacterium]